MAVAAQMHAISARPTDSGSACWASGTEMKIEYATAAAGAMCVIDWNRTCGSPIECSRRCSKPRAGLLAASIAILLSRLTTEDAESPISPGERGKFRCARTGASALDGDGHAAARRGPRDDEARADVGDRRRADRRGGAAGGPPPPPPGRRRRPGRARP